MRRATIHFGVWKVYSGDVEAHVTLLGFSNLTLVVSGRKYSRNPGGDRVTSQILEPLREREVLFSESL